MNDVITKQLNFLGLKYLCDNWDLLFKSAVKQKPSYVSFMTDIIEKEYEARLEKARTARVKRAKIPELFVMETFPFSKQTRLDKKIVFEIYDSLSFIKDKSVLLFLGPTGCGKTGLATSFLVHSINNGYRGCYTSFTNLIDELYRGQGDNSVERIIKRYVSYDVLLIDELGYRSCDKNQAGLFFEVMHSRHSKAATIITTQLGFDEWSEFLQNKHLTAALLDRITSSCVVFNMKDCISIRPKKIIYATKKSEKP